jgi:hypothetical protein
MSRLTMIAEIPNVIIMSLKYETGTTLPEPVDTGFPASSFPRKINSKKQQLQMTVKREKKEITFIEKNSLKKSTYQNNINLPD